MGRPLLGLLCAGLPGTGKSSLLYDTLMTELESTARSSNRPAVVVLDSGGDLVDAIMRNMPEELVPDAIFLDLDKDDINPAFNPVDGELFPDDCGRDVTKEVITDALWDSASLVPEFGADTLLTYAVLLLYEANRGHPHGPRYGLSDMSRLLDDRGFREDMMSYSADPWVINYCQDYEPSGDFEMRSHKQVRRLVRATLERDHNRGVLRAGRGKPLRLGSFLSEGGVLLVKAVRDRRPYHDRLAAHLLLRATTYYPARLDRPLLLAVDETDDFGPFDYTTATKFVGQGGGKVYLAARELTKLRELNDGVAWLAGDWDVAAALFRSAPSELEAARDFVPSGHMSFDALLAEPHHVFRWRHCDQSGIGQTRRPPDGDSARGEAIRMNSLRYHI